jgi:CheY-like chemotaxis protein
MMDNYPSVSVVRMKREIGEWNLTRRWRALWRPMLKLVDILLVEDDASDAELVLAALRERQISTHVVHVVDGYEAMDFIFRSSLFVNWSELRVPRLLLLDLNLKSVSGLDVLRQLKAEDRTKTIPVVVFTGSQRDIDLIESYRLGVNSYVMKPMDGKQFMQTVGDIGHYWMNVNHPPAH